MKIWANKLPRLKKSIYKSISKYELSGGQIELIAKQFLIRNFLEENQDTQKVLKKMIENEISYTVQESNIMGFLNNSN